MNLPSRCQACRSLLCAREAALGPTCGLCRVRAAVLLSIHTDDRTEAYALATVYGISERTVRRYLKLAGELDLPLPRAGRLPAEWTQGLNGEVHAIWATAVLANAAWTPRCDAATVPVPRAA